MKTPKKRWILPYEQWPVIHTKAWKTATALGDVFTEGGLASKWSAKTKLQIIKDYGMWLRHRRDVCLAKTTEEVPALLSIQALKPYVAELQARLAEVSVCSRLRGLSEAYRVMWPDADYSTLRTVLSRLNRNATPSRNKKAWGISSREILNTALDHMEVVATSPCPSETIRASWVRNALMVAMLAVYPLRLANLTGIHLGSQLDLGNGHDFLNFEASETKERRPLTFPIVPTIKVPLEVYLEAYRPILLDGRESDALWISVRKGPMKEQAVYDQIVHTTKKLFGHPINPHLFRDCALTTLATDDPTHVRVGARLLGHSSLKTGEKHYNQATMNTAVAAYHGTLAQLRGSEPPIEDYLS